MRCEGGGLDSSVSRALANIDMKVRVPQIAENSLTSHYYYYCCCLVCEAIGTAATPGLLCYPRVIVKMIVEKQMECRLAGETEVLGEKTCPISTFVHHKSHMTRPGFEPGPPRWEAGD
jgi:hypothetical protein